MAARFRLYSEILLYVGQCGICNNIAMEAMALIEIDGLPFFGLHGDFL